MAFGCIAQAAKKIHHIVPGKPVKNMNAILPGVRQAGPAQQQEVVGRVGHAVPHQCRQSIDATLPLT